MNMKTLIEPKLGDTVKIIAKCWRNCDCFIGKIGTITNISKPEYTIKFPDTVKFCSGFTRSCIEVI